MKLYIVVRRGVHSHGIVGVFEHETFAEAAMILAKAAEEDDYHEFAIIKADVNKLYVGEDGILK